jgi:hypothetical protein
MTDRQIKGINAVTINSVNAYNILDVNYEFVIRDKVRHTPNVAEGLGIRNFTKWHEIELVFDSVTSIFDPYIDDDGKNPAIPSGSIQFATLVAGVEGTETWTFEASKWFVQNRGELRVDRMSQRRPWRIKLIGIGTLTITHT